MDRDAPEEHFRGKGEPVGRVYKNFQAHPEEKNVDVTSREENNLKQGENILAP